VRIDTVTEELAQADLLQIFSSLSAKIYTEKNHIDFHAMMDFVSS